MKINVNQLTQEEFNSYLERIVECAFREGVLWQKCGGEDFSSIVVRNTSRELAAHPGTYW